MSKTKANFTVFVHTPSLKQCTCRCIGNMVIGRFNLSAAVRLDHEAGQTLERIKSDTGFLRQAREGVKRCEARTWLGNEREGELWQ